MTINQHNTHAASEADDCGGSGVVDKLNGRGTFHDHDDDDHGV